MEINQEPVPDGPDYDIGYRAHVAARKHLAAVWEANWDQEEADCEGQGVEIPSPAVGPFCGCDECVIREVLAGAWPVLQDYYLNRLQPTSAAPAVPSTAD